ncbi:hypothetical protein [Gimesia chilikensis]|jgi:hypothetical protein|uniref:hypothetical protein n=1 Tax=Gimesia chilikensis TaxID=2605989 RepID=UPI00118B1D4A|nr:hypothetical protein [Gimesia chilikensis]QDT86041.1 hypothetical protein MalM14_37150 [Gimesia chilikensis]
MGRYGKLFLVGVLIVAGGCMPGVHVKKNPADKDKGIRYYRPKPYLFIYPAGRETTTYNKEGKEQQMVADKSDEFVNIELQYLPDFSEEYAIDVRTGFGTANVEITLEDGWNLTGINQNLDSQTDENLQGIASILQSAGSLASGVENKGRGDGFTPGTTQKYVVPATNVPLGYYESVIIESCVGKNRIKKQLCGWRYVGFAPFNSCPDMLYSDSAEPPDHGIYGLAFRNGVMTFVRLGELKTPHVNSRNPVKTADIPNYTNDPGESDKDKPNAVAPAKEDIEKQGALSLPPALYQQKL